jgi:hypothetical protein
MRTLYIYFIATAFGCLLAGCTGNVQNGNMPNTATTPVTDTAVVSVKKDTVKNTTVPKQDDWLLVQGTSAGGIHLDENADTIVKKLGKPDFSDAAMQKQIMIWHTDHNKKANAVGIFTGRNAGIDETSRVLQIWLTSASFHTSQGLHTGMALDEMRKSFTLKKTESYAYGGKNYTVYDSMEGIAFETDDTGKCTAIIVQKKGAAAEAGYAKFRDQNY